jgi:sterol desaturase/sphingolipid hydroxylase (fatty acid hydroxylase superfamily)
MSKNFISNKDETVRMFDNNFLEALSKIHFSVPLYIYIPIILAFLYRGIFLFNITSSKFIALILLGILVWSLTEYALHRFIFHYVPDSKFGRRIHFIFHGVHHDYPSDSRRLVMPPSVSFPLAVLFYFLFYSIAGRIYVAPFMAGFLTGYLFYDMTHYAVHHFNMHNKFWLAIKNHHMKHHYQDPAKGFGVSSKVWDVIIGTDFPGKNK